MFPGEDDATTVFLLLLLHTPSLYIPFCEYTLFYLIMPACFVTTLLSNSASFFPSVYLLFMYPTKSG